MRKKLLLALLLMGNISIAALARPPKVNDSQTSAINEPNNPISGGAIVETNLSNFLHSGAGGGDSRMKAGFTVGGFQMGQSDRLVPLLGHGSSHLCNVSL